MEHATGEFFGRIQQVRDIQICTTPARWPLRPFLPLRHKTDEHPDLPGLPKLGVLYERDGKVEPTVYLYEISELQQEIRRKADVLLLDQQRYADFERLMAEWSVD